jgi:hypothetical protein
MKKIALSLLVIVAFVITSCEKEVETKKQDSSTLIEKDQPVFKYAPAFCVYNGDEGAQLGATCTSANYQHSLCPQPFPCSPICPGIVSETFSEQEIELWLEGDYNPILTDSFVNVHYDYFLYLFNEFDGAFLSPEEMIDILQQEE